MTNYEWVKKALDEARHEMEIMRRERDVDSFLYAMLGHRIFILEGDLSRMRIPVENWLKEGF